MDTPAYDATVTEFAGLDPAPNQPPAPPLPRRHAAVDPAAATQILPAVPEEVPAR